VAGEGGHRPPVPLFESHRSVDEKRLISRLLSEAAMTRFARNVINLVAQTARAETAILIGSLEKPRVEAEGTLMPRGSETGKVANVGAMIHR